MNLWQSLTFNSRPIDLEIDLFFLLLNFAIMCIKDKGTEANPKFARTLPPPLPGVSMMYISKYSQSPLIRPSVVRIEMSQNRPPSIM